jgi:hypothetical protein
MLLIGQEIDGQRQPTQGQHRDQTLVAERADETIERHGRDMADDRAEFQAARATSGGMEQ